MVVVVLLIAALPASMGAAGSIPAVDSFALDELAGNGKANVFVKMAAEASLDAAEGMTVRTQRVQYAYDTLTAPAASSQRDTAAYLSGRGVQYKSFWINNSLYVYDADVALVNVLANRSDVAYLHGDRPLPLHRPVAAREANAAGPSAIEWGVHLINAPDVWAQGNRGAGIGVANVEPGVR